METLDRLGQAHQGVGTFEILVAEVREIYQKKLWFNISSKLNELFHIKFLSGKELLELYEGFVRLFEEQLSHLVIARLILMVTRKLEDQVVAEKFVEQVILRIENHQKKIVYGTIVLRTEKALCFLRRPHFDEEEVKKQLDLVDGIIVRQGYVEPFVNSYFFKVKSVFHKRTGQFNKFYQTSLLFLSYASIEDELTLEEQVMWAFDIGVAALIGDEVFNFGELLANPVVEKLRNSEKLGWLFKVLIVYNRGIMDDYIELMDRFKDKIEGIKILAEKITFLKKKIQLMSILELAFRKEVGERNLTFKEVASVSKCGMDEVEHILLRALALGLIKGVIDQVNQSIYISWIQPRVLDVSQIKVLRGKMKSWYDRVQTTQNRLRD